MDRKRAPNWVSKAAPDPSPVEGVDNLPIPAGTNRKAVRDAEQASEATPGAMGVPFTSVNYTRDCNGDNPKIADVSGFAEGKDVRSFSASPKSNPTPAKPGA